MSFHKNKIALILSGHLRSYEVTFPSLKKNLLDIHDCDIFISVWDNIDHLSSHYLSTSELEKRISIYSTNVKDIVINKSNGFSELNKQKIKNNETPFGTYTGNKYKLYHGGLVSEAAIDRLTSQWYAVSEGFKLVKEPKNYDYIMRSRFDIEFLTKVNFLQKDMVVAGSYNAGHYYDIRDYLIYGNPKCLPLFKDLYNRTMQNFLRFNNFSAETTLQYTLENNEFGFNLHIDEDLRYDIDYRLNKK